MSQRIYVLTLKTWKEWDRPHHTYGRIHWSDDDGHGDADSESLPDEDGITTIRHETRQEAIDGALRWFDRNGKPDDVLLIGFWGLAGWDPDVKYEVLRGRLKRGFRNRL